MAGLVDTDLVTPTSAVDDVFASAADLTQEALPADPEGVARRRRGVHRAEPGPYRRWILAAGLGVLAAVTALAVLPNGGSSALWGSSGPGVGQPGSTVSGSSTPGSAPAGAGMDVAPSARGGTPSSNPTSRRPVTASGPVRLGELDMFRYCKSHDLGVAKLSGSRTGPNAAFGNWQCSHGRQSTPLAMDDACRWQYSSATAYAKPTDPNDASTWTCLA